MKRTLTLFMLLTAMIPALAKSKIEDDHFLLQGKVYETDLWKGGETPATKVQIVVYQDNDIYVAFYSTDAGTYEFKLPIGHEYMIHFGGSAFVNKKVYVDARLLSPRKGGYDLDLDMGLFRPIDGATFPTLDIPYVKIGWDTDYMQFVPDLGYTELRKKELEKASKKIKRKK